ncbi:MAG: hypothetical protein HY753_01480 [Nitrospirae bacterium]|nr:hypothetical protein [Nitrospirota bacterium]
MTPELTKKYKWVVFALLAIVTLWLMWNMPVFLKFVEFLGHRIPQKDLRVDYLKGLVWAILLGATIFFWPIHSQDRKALLWVWSVKCFVMLCLMLFYEYYYQTDAFGYFSGSRHNISEWERMDLAGPSFVVVFIAWLHNHSFVDSFHATKVSFGMIGLVAIMAMYHMQQFCC